MSDRDALLAAILAHPDEDTPRLAFADWLDENGEDPPRAEFIRLQIGLPARIDAGDPDWPAARRRIAQLRDAHEARWAGAIAPQVVATRGRYDRGFLTSISASSHYAPDAWLDLVGVALAEHPIEALQQFDTSGTDRARLLDAMAGWPQAGNVRELFFSGSPRMVTADLTRLAENPHLRRFTRLIVATEVEAAGLLALTPLADRLTDLEVTTSGEAPDDWCAALGRLLAATTVGRLRVLTHYHHETWLQYALDAVSGSRVSDLAFWFGSEEAADLTAFARWPHTRRLEALDLGWHEFTPEDFVRLLADADFRSLTKFQNTPTERHSMDVAGEAWAALVAAPFAERLTDLDVSAWGLAGADFGPLARGALPNLRHLNLNDTACGDAAAEAIAEAPFVPQLRTLGLLRCGVTDRGAESLLAADLLRVGDLSLSGNPLGEGVRSRLRARFGDRVSVD
jgi:uncharacterized protein (TIGR02996 family)